MTDCPTCYGRLRRVHRTFKEKLLYLAVYECPQCHARTSESRWYALYLGDRPRCPSCGTYRLSRLTSRDRIDPMHKGVINFTQWLLGGDLYHCRYCRLQFYDLRKRAAAETGEKAAAPPSQNSASGDLEGLSGHGAQQQ